MLGVVHLVEDRLVDLLKHTAMEAAAPLLGGRHSGQDQAPDRVLISY